MAKTSALAVANFILDSAAEEKRLIRHLKLQKIVYFCYAWYAGNNHEELFSEDIEAWQFGPVVREIYLEFKDCGSAPIKRRAISLDLEDFDFVEPTINDAALADDLKSVWDEYKLMSDAALVDATHAPDEPWSVLVRNIGRADKRQIPFELIDKIYSKKVAAIGL